MSQIAIKGATTGTGVFTLESPATNTDRTLILPDEAGTVLTSASNVAQKGVTAFQAYLSANFAVVNTISTKIPLDIEVFDTASRYNNTGSTVNGIPAYSFMPDVAGYYQFTIQVGASASGLIYNYIQLRKNGVVESFSIYGPYQTSSSYGTHADLVYMNGTTDYVELYISLSASSSQTVSGSASSKYTALAGVLVRAD